MGIKLDVSLETPLSDDDRDILAGLSVMMLAIANRQNLVDQAQEDETEGMEPLYCGSVAPDASGSCVREPGHSGKHKYRSVQLAGRAFEPRPTSAGADHTASVTIESASDPDSTTARQHA